MSNFWEGLGGKLADQWITAMLTPAFAFWLGGFIVWILHVGLTPLNTLLMQLSKLSPIVQVALLVGGLLVVVVSSSAVQRLDLTVLRWLEGYWPWWLRWLKDWLAGRKYRYFHRKQERFNLLVDKEEQAKEEHRSIPVKEHRERLALSLKLRLVPELEEHYMPTKLGNILRAAENYPFERYGLVMNTCWPRLWLLLPDEAKKEITEARTTLNTAARIFLWSLLFLVWTIWAWWVPLVTVVFAIWAYQWALSAARVYGVLLEAAFDLHRFALYEELRFPLPEDTSVEKAKGEQLTAYLFYGLVDEPITFQKPEETKQELQKGAGGQQDKGSEDH